MERRKYKRMDYVGDTCEAIYKVVQNFKNKQTFNIGSSQRFSNIKF